MSIEDHTAAVLRAVSVIPSGIVSNLFKVEGKVSLAMRLPLLSERTRENAFRHLTLVGYDYVDSDGYVVINDLWLAEKAEKAAQQKMEA